MNISKDIKVIEVKRKGGKIVEEVVIQVWGTEFIFGRSGKRPVLLARIGDIIPTYLWTKMIKIVEAIFNERR